LGGVAQRHSARAGETSGYAVDVVWRRAYLRRGIHSSAGFVAGSQFHCADPRRPCVYIGGPALAEAHTCVVTSGIQSHRANGAHQLPGTVNRSEFRFLRVWSRIVRTNRLGVRGAPGSASLPGANSIQQAMECPLQVWPVRVAVAFGRIRTEPADAPHRKLNFKEL